MNCLFCKIINKEIPAKVIYEDENYLSFLDINPNTKGHALVIPKKHVATFVELSGAEAADLAQVVHKIAPQLIDALGANGFNLGLNNGPAAGQIVEHVHWHIIPRYTGDGLVHWSADQTESARLDDTLAKIKGKIN